MLGDRCLQLSPGDSELGQGRVEEAKQNGHLHLRVPGWAIHTDTGLGKLVPALIAGLQD